LLLVGVFKGEKRAESDNKEFRVFVEVEEQPITRVTGIKS